MINEPTIYFDVDDTLVCWGPYSGTFDGHPDAVIFNCYGRDYALVPYKPHIEALKKHKAEGYKIVVWTHGGAPWGREVVEKLGLQDYVDVIISKPDFYYDDKKAIHFMHEHRRLILEFKP